MGWRVVNEDDVVGRPGAFRGWAKRELEWSYTGPGAFDDFATGSYAGPARTERVKPGR